VENREIREKHNKYSDVAGAEQNMKGCGTESYPTKKQTLKGNTKKEVREEGPMSFIRAERYEYGGQKRCKSRCIYGHT